jgi:hypothetical protein
MEKRPRPPKREAADSEISKVISELHNTEKDKNRHIKASTEPECCSTQEEETSLDSLARLLTGGEVCAAVCYYDSKLVVASNKSLPEYAKTYLSLLKKYIDNPFKDSYQLLEKEANEQIFLTIKDLKNTDKFSQGILNARANGDKLYLNLDNAIVSNDLELIKTIGESIIQNTGSSDQARALAVDVLRPIIDTRIITNALETRKGLAQEIILAIKNDKIEYLAGSPQKHAEMKIFDGLLAYDISGVYCIGIAKLACWPCDATLIMFNKDGKNGKKIQLKFSGTHGGTYPIWEGPNWIISNPEIKQQFLDFLQREAGQHSKSKETAPYIKNFIPSVPILAYFNNIEEVQKFLQNGKIEIDKKEQELIELTSNIKELKDKTNDLSEKINTTQKKLSNTGSEIQDLQKKLKNTKQSCAVVSVEFQKVKKCSTDLDKITKNITLTELKKLEQIKQYLSEENKTFFTNNLIPQLKRVTTVKEKIELAIDAYKNESDIREKELKFRTLEQEVLALEERISNYELLTLTLEKKKEQLNSDKGRSNEQRTHISVSLKKLKEEIKELGEKDLKINASIRLIAPQDIVPNINEIIDENTQNSDTQMSDSRELGGCSVEDCNDLEIA